MLKMICYFNLEITNHEAKLEASSNLFFVKRAC